MGLFGIKSFFHILKNVGQGITNPLNLLILIILIINPSINRIDKGKKKNLAVSQLDRLKSLLQTCTQMKALGLKKVSPKMQTFSPIVITTDGVDRNLLLQDQTCQSLIKKFNGIHRRHRTVIEIPSNDNPIHLFTNCQIHNLLKSPLLLLQQRPAIEGSPHMPI